MRLPLRRAMGRSLLGIGSDDEEAGSLGHGIGGFGRGAATVTGVCVRREYVCVIGGLTGAEVDTKGRGGRIV